MKTIPSDVVQQNHLEVSKFEKNNAETEMGIMVTEQDELIAFVHVVGNKIQKEAGELLMYLAFAVHRMFRSSFGGKLPKIDTDSIVSRYEENSKLFKEKAADATIMEQIAEDKAHCQPQVQQFVVSVLSDQGTEAVKLDDTDRKEIFLALKSIIETIDKTVL